MSGLAVLIAAAGGSSRMRGRDKLLEPVGGMPILRRVALAALGLGAPVLVTLPEGRPARRAALDGLDRLSLAHVTDASEGMAASLRAGAGWAGALEARGLMILLADMPEIDLGDLKTMEAAFGRDPRKAYRAEDAGGTAGHPVIFPARLFARLAHLKGDTGAREVLREEKVTRVALPARHATTDLDTPEAWAAWRLKTGL
ncbi:MAG: nucleotidyltransferase family protein [Roseovarius sp.]